MISLLASMDGAPTNPVGAVVLLVLFVAVHGAAFWLACRHPYKPPEDPS